MSESPVRRLSVVPKKYNKQAIRYLEELLEQAKKGEIVEVVCVYKFDNGLFEHCYTGCDDLYLLIGQIERMKHVMLRRMDT